MFTGEDMKIVYMNDEKCVITVKIQGTAFNDAMARGESCNEFYHAMQPAECRVFDVDMPEHSSIYIKKWPTMVMISYIPDQSLQSLSDASQHIPPSE